MKRGLIVPDLPTRRIVSAPSGRKGSMVSGRYTRREGGSRKLRWVAGIKTEQGDENWRWHPLSPLLGPQSNSCFFVPRDQALSSRLWKALPS